MPAIVPIPTTRTSDYLLRTRLLSQLQFQQQELLRAQNQLSSGRRISAPSEDAPAALRAISLQRLLERKQQVQVNLKTSQSYLNATDSAISGVAQVLADIRGAAVAVVDSTSSNLERQAAAQQVQRTIQQMLDIANQQFRGRYLFAGSDTTQPPFSLDGQYVVYNGNEVELQSFADLNLLVSTNLGANDVFGAISSAVKGTADLNPVLTLNTKLSDLNGGAGVSKGSIAISDGQTTRTIDFKSAETIGDVIRLVEANPPAGRKITARITDKALVVDIDDAPNVNLTIREVGGGTTAAELGILEQNGTISNPVYGKDLNPRLTLTTKLSDILGVRASAIVTSSGTDNDLKITATQRGPEYNGVTIQFVDDSLLQAASGLSAGNETVSYSTSPVAARAALTLPGAGNDLILTAAQAGASLNNVAIQLTGGDGLGDNANVTFGLVGTVPTLSIAVDDVAGPAKASLALSGADNDLLLTANQSGTSLNNVNIVIEAVNGLGNNANVTFAPVLGVPTLTIQIDDAGATTLGKLVEQINLEGTFTAAHDLGSSEGYDDATFVNAADAGVVSGNTGTTGNDATTLQTLIDAIAAQGLFTAAADTSAGETLNPTAFISALGGATITGNTGNSGAEANTLLVNIAPGLTTANQVAAAINADPVVSALFRAEIDDKDKTSKATAGTKAVSLSATATLAGGAGIEFDKGSGLQVVNGGKTYVIQFQQAETIEDLLNTLNSSGANLLASLNESGTGIDIRSRLSGADFSIGENGGTTASELGVRSFTRDTFLADLNHGFGVHTTEGTDFTIRRNDGVELKIDVSQAKTVGDVLDLINKHPDNLNPQTAVVARLSTVGNGLEIVDDNPIGAGTLQITANPLSQAAADLGLVPYGETTNSPATAPPPLPAVATVVFAAPDNLNNSIKLTANQPGTQLNGVNIVFVNNAATGNQALVSFDPAAQTLTIDVDPAATTANTVLAAVNQQGTFTAELDRTIDQTNSGDGLITQTGNLAFTAGGTPHPSSQAATAALRFGTGTANNDILVTADQPGTLYNDVSIVFQNDTSLTGDQAVASFNAGAGQLLVRVNTSLTTANTVAAAIRLEGHFTATLDRSVDATNDGTGLVGNAGTAGVTSGGTPEVLTGTDVGPLETKGIFNTLIRLNQSLQVNDSLEIERSVQLMDTDLDRLTFSRAELGARQRSMDSLQLRLEDENVELQSSLSQEIDVDLAQAISDLTARQASVEASLRTIAGAFQLTLLDFL